MRVIYSLNMQEQYPSGRHNTEEELSIDQINEWFAKLPAIDPVRGAAIRRELLNKASKNLGRGNRPPLESNIKTE